MPDAWNGHPPGRRRDDSPQGYFHGYGSGMRRTTVMVRIPAEMT